MQNNSACIIAFQINDENRKNILLNELKAYSNHYSILDNCWAIVSDKKPTDICNSLLKHLSANDKLFIIQSGLEASAAWVSAENAIKSEWLKENL